MVVFSAYPFDPRPRRAADALLGQGMEVDLVCVGEGEAPRRERIGGLSILRVPITSQRGGKLSYVYRYLVFILAAGAVFAFRSFRRRYDLVYVHNMPDVLVVSSFVPKLLGAKVILDLHDPMPELMTTIYGLEPSSFGVRLIQWLERWSMARADLALTVNIACKRIFAERSCPAEKIGVVMNSPDERIFPLRPPEPRPAADAGSAPRFVIMYHGSLVERNGLELAVSALPRVREAVPGVELKVYGRKTAFLESVMEEARRQGVDECVSYLGRKSLEDLVGEIAACDVGIVPNQRNAFTDINTPTRIFEYLTMGKPVIAPWTPGIQDYFDQESLFFFESGNAEQLAERIVHVHDHPAEAVEVTQRGQQVYSDHRWSRERNALVGLVSGLLPGEARQ